MARLIGLDEQQKALQEVVELLKKLGSINAFMEASSSDGKYKIFFTDLEGKRFSTEIFCESKDEINIMILNSKETINKRILGLCERYNIGLDEDDKKLLDIPVEKTAEEAPQV